MEMTFDEFSKEFRPELNLFSDDAPFDGCMHDICGDDIEYVKAVLSRTPERVWTIVDEDGELIILAGFKYVNRYGYIITQVPYSETNRSIIKIVD